MGDGADLFHLLGRAHRESLVLLCEAGQQPFSGLQAGARLLCRRRSLSPRLAKKLANLETAFAFLRHVTPQHVDAFLKDLREDIKGGTREAGEQSGTGPRTSPRPASCPGPDDKTATGKSPDPMSAQLGGDQTERIAPEPLIQPAHAEEIPQPHVAPHHPPTSASEGPVVQLPGDVPVLDRVWLGDDDPARFGLSREPGKEGASDPAHPPARPQGEWTKQDDPQRPPAAASEGAKTQFFDMAAQDPPQCPGRCAYADFSDFSDHWQFYNDPTLFLERDYFRSSLERAPLYFMRMRERGDKTPVFAALHGLKGRPELNGKLAWIDLSDFNYDLLLLDRPDELLDTRISVGPLDHQEVFNAIRNDSRGEDEFSVEFSVLSEMARDARQRPLLRIKCRNLRFFDFHRYLLCLGKDRRRADSRKAAQK